MGRELGTLRFLMWAMLTTFGSNATFLAAMQGLSGSTSGRRFHYFHFLASQGLWPLLMVCITLRSLLYPNVLVDVFGLIKVSNIWYPFGLAAGLSLNTAVQWDCFTSIGYTYISKALKLEKWLLPSSATVQRVERWIGTRVLQRGLFGGMWLQSDGRHISAPDNYRTDFNSRRRNFEETPNTTSSARRDNFRFFEGQGHR